ncbi:hypothetical protein ACWGOQ_0019255 [Aquimarina sp. M1]
MNKSSFKKGASFFLIFLGAVLLVVEIAFAYKNYYMQSMGIICLMTGVFIVNTKVASRSTETKTNYHEHKEKMK